MGLKKFFRKIKIKLIRKFIIKKRKKDDSFYNDPFIYD
jgi:hypothetical protein